MSPRTLGGADGPDADADFWRWASSRGVVAVRCESRDVAEGWRGIVATEVIERDAVVLRVPGALLMSARSMNEDTQLCDAFRAYDSSAGADDPGGQAHCAPAARGVQGARLTMAHVHLATPESLQPAVRLDATRAGDAAGPARDRRRGARAPGDAERRGVARAVSSHRSA